MAILKTITFKIFVIFFVFRSGWAKPTIDSKVNNPKSSPKLIVISMDGLMFHQIQENVMPFTRKFYKNGVHCPNLQPVFPTKTLVNHFSIATGTIIEKNNFSLSPRRYQMKCR